MSGIEDLEAFASAFSARRETLRVRVALSFVVLLAATAATHSALFAAWFVLYLLMQLLERWVFTPRNTADLSFSPRGRQIASAFLSLEGCAFGIGPTLYLVLTPTHDLALAMVAPIAVLIGGITQTRGSRSVFLAGLLPQGFLLAVVLPLIDLAYGDTLKASMNGALAGFALNVAAVFAWREYSTLLRIAKDARAEAESATAAKSAFVAMVSHELRTPITAIQAGADSLAARAKERSIQNDAGLIIEASRMMRALLDDLLDMSKIEAGQMTVETVTFDARLLLRNTAKFWRSEARKRQLRLTLLGSRHLPRWLIGDPTRTRQILNNLLSNALKFTEAGEVRITVERRCEGELALSVVDSGPGMSPAHLRRLFKPFSQADETVSRTHGGTGLGLAISRDLARLIGGDITVSSQQGSGSTFTLLLKEQIGTPPTGGVETQMSPPVLPKLRILVADDHEINRRAIGLILGPIDADLTLVSDGREALACLAADRFDLALLDIHMPGVGGVEVTRQVRGAAGINQRLPIIAITGAAEEAAKYAAAGMNACVAKPIDPSALYAAIERVLEATGQDADRPGANPPSAIGAAGGGNSLAEA